MFLNRIKTIITTGLTIVALFIGSLCSSCTKDSIDLSGSTEGLAISIFATKVDGSSITKAAAPKEQFQNGDVIHISAKFTIKGGLPDVSSYASMRFDGTNWVPSDRNTSFNWPWNAAKGDFTAYYIPAVGSFANNVPMNNTSGQNVLTFNITDICTESVSKGVDPLIATYSNVPVESAVHLQFSHLLTKITIKNLGLEKGYVAGSLAVGTELRISFNGIEEKISFTREAAGNALSHALIADGGFVASKVEKETETSFNVTYLMAPVTANTNLRIAFKDFTPYHMIPIEQNLEAGVHYSIDVTKLADNFIDESLKEEQWNIGNVAIVLTTADINKYLQAIRDGVEYIVGGVQVLSVYEETVNGTPTRVVAQIRDVDFNNQTFTPVNLTNNIVFQGNNHKVMNVKITSSIDGTGNAGSEYQALFGRNAGVIKNYIIENAVNTSGSVQYVSILTGSNTGTIDNVRVNFKNNDQIAADNTQYIGVISGSNSGRISNCIVNGSSIKVTAKANIGTNPIYIGGLIGYNSNSVVNSNVSVSSSEVVYEGSTGTIYAGGWAGYSIVSAAGESVSKSSSSMDVNIKGGTTVYAGGWAGLVSNSVKNCYASGKVTVPASATTINAGGFAGRAINTTINACYATGELATSAAAAANIHIGGFAGLATIDGTATTTIINSYTLSKVPTTTGLGFFANDGGHSEVSVKNSFSKNNATSFANTSSATISNVHHNGKNIGGTNVTAADLNGTSKPTGGFDWKDSPALYGAGIPYLVLQTVN